MSKLWRFERSLFTICLSYALPPREKRNPEISEKQTKILLDQILLRDQKNTVIHSWNSLTWLIPEETVHPLLKNCAKTTLWKGCNNLAECFLVVRVITIVYFGTSLYIYTLIIYYYSYLRISLKLCKHYTEKVQLLDLPSYFPPICCRPSWG